MLESVRNKYLLDQAAKHGQTMQIKEKVSSLSNFEIKELTRKLNGSDVQAVVNPSDIKLEEDDPEQVL